MPGVNDEADGLEPEEIEDAPEDEELDGFEDEGGDEDSEDHEGEDPSGEDEGEEGQPHQVGDQRSSRGQRRFSELSRRAREAETRAAEADRRAQEAERRAQAGRLQDEQASEAERLAGMSFEERIDYRFDKMERQRQQELAQVRFETQDNADKTAFDTLCTRNPTASRLKDEVEAALSTMRKQGTNAPRETVLKYLIGERALKNIGQTKGRQERRADTQRQRQQARPGSGSSDVQRSSGRTTDEREARRKRLEDVEI